MDLHNYNLFAEAAMLNNSNYQERREESLHFIECEIMNCQYDNWWYAPFLGIRFIGVIEYDLYKMKLCNDDILIIDSIHPVKVTNKSIITKGRHISAKDVLIL